MTDTDLFRGPSLDDPADRDLDPAPCCEHCGVECDSPTWEYDPPFCSRDCRRAAEEDLRARERAAAVFSGTAEYDPGAYCEALVRADAERARKGST